MSCNTASFEINIRWTSTLEGYVNGLRFYIENTVILFRSGFKSGKKKATQRLNQFRKAIEATPEYSDAKRECKAEDMIITSISANSSFTVLNPLNANLYHVVKSEGELTCNCPDHFYRQSHCKHIRAVERHLEQSQQPILLSSYAGRAIRMGGRKGLKAVSESLIELTPAEAKASIGL